MARAGTGAPRLGSPTLTAADWAEAALQLMAEAGLRALTVDALAARLGVTKGSFYWHFRGRRDLLAAALQRWEHGATVETIAGLNVVADPRARLQLMLGASAQPPRARSLYAALAEAADDVVVREVLHRVATARIGYLQTCYRELGASEADAKARAVLAYAAYRGLLQLAHEAPAALPSSWTTYADAVTAAFLPPETTRRPSPARRKPVGRTSRT